MRNQEPQPGTPIPRHRDPSGMYLGQSQSEKLDHHNPRMVRHEAHSCSLDTHGSEWKVGLG